jgi:LacI family transcriptional regulator/LacI family repressor for deo operon, udp, cdd, tsx, nupC, and nupG
LRGVQNEAQRRRADVLLIPDEGGPHWETLDGVIMMGVRDFGMPHLPHGLPAVSVMQSIDGIPSVLMDDGQGVRDAVNHLLELGHRRISFLGSLPDGHADSQRLEAYARALVAGGVTPEPQWVRPVHNIGEPLTEFVELGAQKMRSWLAEGWASMGCTALLAQNDETAIGVIETLREAGIDVPQTVSVVGFDGLKVGKYFKPSLTTIRVPLEEVGARAVSLLMDLAANDATSANSGRSNLLPVQLLVRESTAPCHARRSTP